MPNKKISEAPDEGAFFSASENDEVQECPVKRAFREASEALQASLASLDGIVGCEEAAGARSVIAYAANWIDAQKGHCKCLEDK